MEISLTEGKNKQNTYSKGPNPFQRSKKRIPDIIMIPVSKLYHTKQSESDKS